MVFRGLPPFKPLSAAANLFFSVEALPPRFPISLKKRRTGDGRGSFFVFIFFGFFLLVSGPVNGGEVVLVLLGCRVGPGFVPLSVPAPLAIFDCVHCSRFRF